MVRVPLHRSCLHPEASDPIWGLSFRYRPIRAPPWRHAALDSRGFPLLSSDDLLPTPQQFSTECPSLPQVSHRSGLEDEADIPDALVVGVASFLWRISGWIARIHIYRMAVWICADGNEGKGCSEYRANHPHGCIYTRMIAAAIQLTTKHEGKGLDETQAAPEILLPGEEGVGSHEAGEADALEEEDESRRTAASLIKEDLQTYTSNLRDTFNPMAIYKVSTMSPMKPASEALWRFRGWRNEV